jgi:ParB/RepB/Spo0J family partition protein
VPPTESVKIKDFKKDLPVDLIDVADTNVRKTRRSSRLDELEASIQRFGLIHPVIVIPKGDRYKLIVGQRRYLAFKELGKPAIPAIIISSIDSKEQSIVSFAENIHRRELPYEDTIQVCTALFNEYGGPKVDRIRRISEELGIPASTVRTYLSYVLIPPEVRKLVDANLLTRGQARSVTEAYWPNTEKIIKIANRVTRLTTDERERALELGKKKPKAGVDEIINEALEPPKVFEIVIALEMDTYELLERVAKKRDTTVVDFVKEKILELMPDIKEELVK